MAPFLYRLYRTCCWLRAFGILGLLFTMFASHPSALAAASFALTALVAHFGCLWAAPAARRSIDNHITTRLMGEVFPGRSRARRARIARFKNRG